MKAVLAIDMPNRCSECPLCSKDENYWGDIVSAECQMQYKGYLTLNEMEKPYWCPLRQLPSFKAVDLNDTRDVVMFCHGWNTCLAEITGETE